MTQVVTTVNAQTTSSTDSTTPSSAESGRVDRELHQRVDDR